MTNEEARQLAALQQQQRDIRVIKFSPDADSTDIVVTGEEIEEYYRSNPERYMTPERVSVEYIEITSDELADSIDVDEEKIAQMYGVYKQTLLAKEERKARHILIQTGSSEEKSKEALMPKIEELQQRLNEGESFEALAREYSEDPGSAKEGGDLGWVAAGDMVKSFEDVLFSLNKGEISGIVETQFGLHLIKLEDSRTPEVKTLAEMRSELEKEIKQDVLSSMFYDISEDMAVTAYENPDSLDAVVDAVNKQPVTTELFTRDAGTGIAENQKFRNAAFASSVIQERLNSDVIELSPDHVAVLRLLKHEPASMKPLETVKVEIENTLRMKKAHDRKMAAAEEAKTRVSSGEAAESVLSENQRIEDYGTLKRADMGKVDPSIVEAAFRMPHPEDGKPSTRVVNMMSGDIALVLLDRVTTPAEVTPEQIDAVLQQRKNDVANAEFDYVITAVKDAAEIQRNTSLLQ
jgi:peptidyl-prolyl cis-trans isomerase D